MSVLATNRKPISRYVPRPTARHAPPIPPQWLAHERPVERPPLWHFVFLSMLLHALAIALFGAPSGGSREGQAMWGSLEVALLPGPLPVVAPSLKLETKLSVDRAPVARERPKAPAKPVPEKVAPIRLDRQLVVPPLLDRIVTPDRKPEMLPIPKVPPPTEVQAIPAPPVLTPPIERSRIETPALPALAPAPAIEPPVETRAIPVVPTPPMERAPIETPALPSLAPAPIVERPPVESPAVPVQPIERAIAPEIQEAPKVAPPVERVTPRAPELAPPARIEPRLEGPSPRPSAIESLPQRGPRGEGEQPTAPALDLDAIRQRAGQIAREGSGQRAILPFPMPPVPERKSKMQTAIENARKPDCRTAYQSLGLAAIVPLIANEFGEGNCRW